MSDANAAQYIRKAIDEFRKTDPTYLNQVDVVIFQERMLAAFQSALIGRSVTPSKASKPKPKAKKSEMLSVPTSSSNVIVNVTGGDILTSTSECLINTTGDDFDLYGNYFCYSFVL